jgi:hypothetical protein
VRGVGAVVPEPLRVNLLAFYGDVDALPGATDAERRRSTRIRQLAGVDSANTP